MAAKRALSLSSVAIIGFFKADNMNRVQAETHEIISNNMEIPAENFTESILFGGSTKEERILEGTGGLLAYQT